MATTSTDSLVFPVNFDLDNAIKRASGDSRKLLKTWQAEINANPLILNIKNTDDNIKDIKKRVKELTKEWNSLSKAELTAVDAEGRYTGRARQILSEYVRLRGALQSTHKELSNIEKASQRAVDAEIKAAQKAEAAAKKQADAASKVNRAYANQSTYISRLIQRMGVYASVATLGNFLTQVREVTAQFELQKVSLGAIIQDQSKANSIFGEIKSFALKSPVKILDLTTYTKRLAAYRVETDKLFETTKRLADVSVGLGVDMDRLILAYGETKASNVMNAKELRQFAMMGIPMLELLSEKLSEIKGKTISTGETFEMIKKRMVHFDVVADVFNDMTEKGGIFYNMQEKQGNTLYGLWAKLGDAASVMYDSIGNTGVVNSGMKIAIQWATDLMKNWRNVGLVIGQAAVTFGVYKLAVLNANIATNAASAANKAHIATLNAKLVAANREIIATKNAAAWKRTNIMLDAMYIKAQIQAASATNIFSKAMYSLKAAFLAHPWMWVILALSEIVTYLVFADDKAKRFRENLENIQKSGAAESAQSVYNFKRLADEAVNAADGSKQQRDALEELQRTYQNIIPVEELTIENLRKQKDGYAELTAAIEQYIAKRTMQQQVDAIIEERSGEITTFERKARSNLKSPGWPMEYRNEIKEMQITDDQISDLFSRIKTLSSTTTKSAFQVVRQSIDETFGYLSERQLGVLQAVKLADGKNLAQIVEMQRNMDAEIRNTTQSMARQTGELQEYSKAWEDVGKKVENLTITGAQPGSLLFSRKTTNATINEYTNFLKEVLGTAWSDAFASTESDVKDATSRISAIFFDKIKDEKVWSKLSIAQKNAVRQVIKEYENLVPTDRTVNILRERVSLLAAQYSILPDQMKQYLMEATEEIDAYADRIKTSLDEAKSKVKELQLDKAQMNSGIGVGILKPVSDEELENASNEVKMLSALFDLIKGFAKGSKSGGNTQDPRLQNLKEEISLTTKLYNEYDKLKDKIGEVAAKSQIQSAFGNTIKELQAKARKYGFEFKTPFDSATLQQNLQNFIAQMRKLQGLKGAKGKNLFPSLGKDIDEAVFQLENISIDEVTKAAEKRLKALQSRVSRLKTANEFFEKIFESTGNRELSAKLTVAVYGTNGEDLKQSIIDQIKEVFKGVDVSEAINRRLGTVDYAKLQKIYETYKDFITKDNQPTAESIIQSGMSEYANRISTWQKELAKAKDFEQQRTEIIEAAEKQRADIIKSNLADEEKQRWLALSRQREQQQLAGVDEAEFKASDDYVKIFQDLDKVSSATLARIKTKLKELIDSKKDLEDATNLKTLVSALDKINEEQLSRNPIKHVIASVKGYRDALKKASDARKSFSVDSEETLTAELEYSTAMQQQEAAQSKVNQLREQGLIDTEEGLQAQLALNTAVANTLKAEQKVSKAKKKEEKSSQNITNAEDEARKYMSEFQQSLTDASSACNSMADAIQKVSDALDVASDSEIGILINGAVTGLQTMSAVMSAILAIAVAISSTMWWVTAIGAAVGALTAIVSVISSRKVKKANEEIERQQDLIDQLSYAYDRLENAQDKAFGSDYIRNYKQRLASLQAQQKAYLAQAEAERSKGKKADDDKIQDYLESARDAADEIKDMASELSEYFTDSDLASAAQDFAEAWLDAYLSFSSTTDAIKEQFNDMIQSMVVKSLMAKVVEAQLQPFFDQIDELAKDGELTAAEIQAVTAGIPDAIDNIDSGLRTTIASLKAAGVDVSSLSSDSDTSGITRNFAEASEESVNGLAAMTNTNNYYVSFVPGIAANVATIRALLESSISSKSDVDFADAIALQQQSVTQLQMIERHTAESLTQCKLIAQHCENIADDVSKVISARNSKASKVVNVQLV
jgi:hypothetical protein